MQEQVLKKETRGQPLAKQAEKKYNWRQLENGNYVIFSVPLFRAYNSTNRGSISISELNQVVDNFKRDKAKGIYARVFIGHHNLTSKDQQFQNKKGVGYLDYLFIKNDIIKQFCLEREGSPYWFKR